jgi:hypothetical protein
MAKIRFLADYRGVLTQERFYQAGAVVEDDSLNAPALVAAGRAEYVQDEPEPKPAAPTKRTYTRKPRGKAVKNEP